MMFYTYALRNVVGLDDLEVHLTREQQRHVAKRITDAMDRELEKALYGGYAPPIDPNSVVAEQTPGQKRIETI